MAVRLEGKISAFRSIFNLDFLFASIFTRAFCLKLRSTQSRNGFFTPLGLIDSCAVTVGLMVTTWWP